MNYLFDFDTREFQCCSKRLEVLLKYVIENNLGDAVTLVSNSAEIDEKFSEREIREANDLLLGEPFPGGTSTAKMAEKLWALLESETIPEYNLKLGKKLIKVAEKSRAKGAETPVPKAKAKAKPVELAKATKASPRKRTSRADKPTLDTGAVYVVGDATPPRGRHKRIQEFVESNLGCTGEQLLTFLSDEKGNPERHIIWAIKHNFIAEDL